MCLRGVTRVAHDVTVAIPWRATPSRVKPYQRVREFWASMGFPVVTADSNPWRPFNRAQARNRAVAQVGTEYVVVADADSLPEKRAIVQALATVQGEVVLPFTANRVISAAWVDELDLAAAPTADGPLTSSDDVTGVGTGGVWVMRTVTWHYLGGMDERFVRWGGEDASFIALAATLAGARRVEGMLVAFDHDLDGDTRTPHVDPHLKPVEAAYDLADGDPAAMEKLVNDTARGSTPSRVDEWRARFGVPQPGRVWV